MASLNDIQLNPQSILKKQFRTKMKGYDSDEVDSYLDTIISDYSTFATIIEDLQTQISDLKAQQKQQTAKSTAPKLDFKNEENEDDVKTYTPQKVQKAAVNNTNEDKEAPELTTNVAMIQRISTLERKVYNLEQRMNQQDRTYQAN
ncbi:DivIVA domain-containing protein [Lactobacillus johnsonii]|uniref:DivIVA domain-containing protein n=1 Tax=Lactobacillus johnsonii TaxID=33959 RepID=UPI0010723EBE|nr:DivIVA domain-containing protein [Lactobacillus johnsonii]MBF0771177.1 DivIVA domain-containing protein [Lactobacillus johnsonii]TFU80207.1 DivIVA domain-containing protein [Lactobacillus johnsonii]